MPYSSIKNLPDNVKNVLPPAAQRIWMNGFNDAIKDNKSEDSARKLAWHRVKSAGYKKGKDGGKWVKADESVAGIIEKILRS